MATATFKVVLLGEGRVGKTCLCLRYVQNTFSPEQESTIQATFLKKRLNVGRKTVELNIWDTAGQERFHALGPIYYRDSNGALLIYDITDRDSFTKVRNWVRELRKIVGKDIVLLIIGNKEDLEKKRQVDNEEAEQYAKSVGAEHMLVSAKTGKNVEQIFLELTKQMLKMKESANANSNALTGGDDMGSSRRPGRGRTSVDITTEPEQKSGGCC
jgi:Ras-related protein Rab-21